MNLISLGEDVGYLSLESFDAIESLGVRFVDQGMVKQA